MAVPFFSNPTSNDEAGFCRKLTLFLDQQIEVPLGPCDLRPSPILATLQNGNFSKPRYWLPLLSRHLHLLPDEGLSNDGIDIGMENVKRNRKRAGRSSRYRLEEN